MASIIPIQRLQIQQEQEVRVPNDILTVRASVALRFLNDHENHGWRNPQERLDYLRVAAQRLWGQSGPQYLGVRAQFERTYQSALNTSTPNTANQS